jgi:hypothetical protein
MLNIAGIKVQDIDLVLVQIPMQKDGLSWLSAFGKDI